MPRLKMVALGLLLVLSLGFPVRAQEPLRVVATTAMIADAARQVGSERVEVEGLLGPGIDPHSYRQTRSDIAKLLKADLVLWHGLYLEAQMEDFFTGLAKQKPVVAVGEAVPVEERIPSADYADRYDPHVWMAPPLWKHVVEGVRDALTEADPEGAEFYAANTRAYLAEIDALHDLALEAMATIPENARVLVTAHDAFSYFGRAYGVEVKAIQGISTESEAGLKQIESLVDLLAKAEVPAVFVETSVAERNVKALVEGAAARGYETRIGGELFSDAMGAQGTYEGTYIGMIDHNVSTITRALGGTVSDAGLMGMKKAL